MPLQPVMTVNLDALMLSLHDGQMARHLPGCVSDTCCAGVSRKMFVFLQILMDLHISVVAVNLMVQAHLLQIVIPSPSSLLMDTTSSSFCLRQHLWQRTTGVGVFGVSFDRRSYMVVATSMKALSGFKAAR